MERTILHCDMNNFYASVECSKTERRTGEFDRLFKKGYVDYVISHKIAPSL